MKVDNEEKWLNKKIYGHQFVCKKHSELTKQKISKSLLLRDYSDSEETRLKKSLTKLGNKNPNKNGEARKGAILTEETKQKISSKLIGHNYGTWWNNGQISKRSINQPDNSFKPGRISWQ